MILYPLFALESELYHKIEGHVGDQHITNFTEQTIELFSYL